MLKILISVFFKEQQGIKLVRATLKRKLMYLLGATTLLIFVYMSILSPVIFNHERLSALIGIDFGTIFLSMMFFILFIVSVISAFAYVLSGGYLDKSLQHYLVLPIKKRDFVFSKLCVAYFNIILMLYFISLPFIVTYFYLGSATILGVISIILYPLICALIALYLAIVIIGTLLFFINKIRNKAIARACLYGFFFFVGMSLYLGSVFYISYRAGQITTLEEMAAFITELNMTMTNLFFVPAKQITFLKTGDLLELGYLLLACLIGSLSFFYYEQIYFKGAIGFAEGGNSFFRRKKKNKLASNSSVMKWFFFREFKELTSGTFFLNTIFSNILIVVIYLGMIIYNVFFGEQNNEAIGLINEYSQMITISHVIVVTFGIATFFGFFSFGGASAFSRDAYNIEFISTLPIDQAKAFFGKVLFNALVEFLTIAAFLIPVFLIVKVNFLFILVSLLVMALVSITLNFVPVMMDLLFPTLDWQSETALAKRAKSLFATIFANIIFIGIYAAFNFVLLYYFKLSFEIVSLVLIVFYVILLLGYYKLYQKLIIRAFKRVLRWYSYYRSYTVSG